MSVVTGGGRRVLIVNTVAPPPFIGGAERSVMEMAAELKAAGHHVAVAGLVRRRTDAGIVDDGGIVFYRSPIRNLYWPWDAGSRRYGLAGRALWQLIDCTAWTGAASMTAVVNAFRPDVIITNNLRGWGTAPWRVAEASGIPLVHVARDHGLVCVKSTMYRDGRNCDRLCAGCSLKAMSSRRSWPRRGVVSGVSAAVVDRLREFGLFRGQENFVTWPRLDATNGAPQPDETEAAIYRSRVGFLGRVSPEKGVDILARAADKLRLVVDVAGPVTREVRAEIEAISSFVNFVGERSAVRFLQAHDVIVVPSGWREAFGRVVGEAAAAGCRVIVADWPGLVEAAQVTAASYAVFAPGDADSLCRVLAGYQSGQPIWRKQPIDESRAASAVDLVRRATERV